MKKMICCVKVLALLITLCIAAFNNCSCALEAQPGDNIISTDGDIIVLLSISNLFDDTEYQAILNGMQQWSYASANAVQWRKISYPASPDMLINAAFDDDHIIVTVELVFSGTAEVDKYDESVIGVAQYMHDRYTRIILIVDRIADINMLQRVAAHEIGHALGIRGHIVPPPGMSPSPVMVAQDNVTECVTMLDLTYLAASISAMITCDWKPCDGWPATSNCE